MQKGTSGRGEGQMPSVGRSGSSEVPELRQVQEDASSGGVADLAIPGSSLPSQKQCQCSGGTEPVCPKLEK